MSSVSTFAVTVLSMEDFCPEVVLNFFALTCSLVGFSVYGDRVGLFVFLEVKLPLRIIAIVPEEGRDTCQFLGLLVGCKFQEG